MEKTGKTLGFLNPLLYQMYSEDPTIFQDITSGNNVFIIIIVYYYYIDYHYLLLLLLLLLLFIRSARSTVVTFPAKDIMHLLDGYSLLLLLLSFCYYYYCCYCNYKDAVTGLGTMKFKAASAYLSNLLDQVSRRTTK